jgi:2-methylcitrate dehydratase PrpD
MLGNSCKSLNIGKAAAAGVIAALLAEADLDSEPNALEAKFGFFHAFGEPRDFGVLVRDGDSRYLVEEVSLKPYPCGVVIHPLIDACVTLARPGELLARDVSGIRTLVHPRALELADRRHPENALEGRYSLQHAAALAFTRGSAGLADFDGASVDDPELKAWRELIEIRADPDARLSNARVILELRNGERHERDIQHPSGSPERPLTDMQLHRKFTELASRALEKNAAEHLYRDCMDVDRLEDANALRRHWATAPLT